MDLSRHLAQVRACAPEKDGQLTLKSQKGAVDPNSTFAVASSPDPGVVHVSTSPAFQHVKVSSRRDVLPQLRQYFAGIHRDSTQDLFPFPHLRP